MEDITISPGLNKLFADVAQPTQVREQVPPPEPMVEVKETENQKEVPPIDEKLVNASAEIAMALLDGAQNTALKIWATARRNTRANEITGDGAGLSKLNKAVSNYSKGNGDRLSMASAEDMQLLDLNEKAQELIQDLPLSEKETERLIIPLKYIIEKNGGNIPIELGFILGIATCIGGRIGEIYTL